MHTPELIAHRGYSSKYPENTLASIEAALSAGANFVEFDVQMMADDEFILMHDDNLHRSSGIRKSVFSLTSRTIRNFQADYFSTFNGQFTGIKIPILDHAVSLFKQFPDAIPIIEIKEESLEEFGVEHVMKKLLNDLKDIKDRCYIISFSEEAIDYVNKNSDYQTGFVLHKFDDEHREKAERLKPDLLICNYRKLPDLNGTGKFPEDTLWEGDWLWGVYIVDNTEQALALGNAGITFVETDHIGMLLQHSEFAEKTGDNTE